MRPRKCERLLREWGSRDGGLGWFYWNTYLLYPLPSIGGGCGCWSRGAMCICMYAIRGYVWRWLRLLEAAALDTSFTICSTSTAASHVVHRMHQLRGSHCLANAATQLCALEMSVAKVHTGVLKVCKITTASSYCVAHVVGPCATMPVFRNNANPPQQLDVPARAGCHRCRFCARAVNARFRRASSRACRRRSTSCASDIG